MRLGMVLVLVLVLATSVFGLEKKAYQMREDYGTEPLYDCVLQYYYYIPCPTYGWFWSYSGWSPGDVIGTFFLIGEESMGGYTACDPCNCQEIEALRVLDFAGFLALLSIDSSSFLFYSLCFRKDLHSQAA